MTSSAKKICGAVLLICLALSGCGSEEKPPKYATHKDRDAEVETDAGPDASPDVDAAQGGTGGKAGSGGAAGSAGSAGKPGSGPPPCSISEDDNSYSAPVAFSDDSRFSMTTGSTGFGVAYGAPDCSIQVLPVEGTGSFMAPAKPIEDCGITIREVSLAHVADGWRMVWVDNKAGSAELQTMVLRDDMSEPVGDLRTQLTTNELHEQRPVLANVAGSPLLAYTATDPVSRKQRISTHLLDGQSSAQDVIAEDAGHQPSSLALIQMGAANAALAWIEEQGKPGVWLQPTDLRGVAKGAPILLSELAGPGSAVDLAARDKNEGGAALYSLNIGGVNREVRFRRLDEKAGLLADERKVVGAPLQARDASFARLGGGYVVAYRALPGGPISTPEIRVTFISKEGTLQHDTSGSLLSYKIADTSEAGGRLTVRVSNDGQLLIAFVDASAAGKQLRLVRKRLDCAL